MELSFAALAGNLLAPTILFFVLGLIAAFAKSDLSIPEGAAKVMSIYLLLAIGFKGGAAVGESGIDSTLLASLGAGIVLSFILPFIAYALIRHWFDAAHNGAKIGGALRAARARHRLDRLHPLASA